jgi:hypothetical protein
MIIIECPDCGKETIPIRYGKGWVGVCCNRVVFSSRQLPPDRQKNYKNLFIAMESNNQGQQ